MKNLKEALAERRVQLESIKQFIPLKTYNAITEKLDAETASAERAAQQRSAATARDQVPQAMPRGLFEERHMPPKTIRID